MTKSNTPQVKIVNCQTGEEIIRDANEDELAQIQTDAANVLAKKAEQEAKSVEKQTILNRLGLTAEEAALLLS